MKEKQILEWQNEHGITEQGRRLLERIRSSGPVREVRSSSGNVIGNYPCKTMDGQLLPFESRTLELPVMQMKDRDPSVLEIYTQPNTFEISYLGNDGKMIATTYTPDLCTLEKRGLWWYECKPEEKLSELAKKMPNRYRKDSEGKWHSPPMEECARKYGGNFMIVTDREIPWNRIINADFLAPYLQDPLGVNVPSARMEAIIRFVDMYPGSTIKEIFEAVEGASADEVFWLITKEVIWVDLEKHLLADSWKVPVYSSRFTCDVNEQIPGLVFGQPDLAESPLEGMELSWDGERWNITKVTDEAVYVKQNSTSAMSEEKRITRNNYRRWVEEKAIRLIKTPKAVPGAAQDEYKKISTKAWEIAAERNQFVEEYLSTGKAPAGYRGSLRHLQRWAKKFRESREARGEGIWGLVPRDVNKGRRDVKMADPERIQWVLDRVKEYHLAVEAPKIMVTVAKIRAEAEEAGYIAPAYRTICHIIEKFDLYEEALERLGRRGAEPLRPACPPDINKPSVEGERFMDVAHADCTPIDLELVDGTGRNVGKRAWLTLIVDGATRYPLGYCLSLRRPSRATFFTALRDSFRRWGRIPSITRTDNGSEFANNDFKAFCARYGVLQDFRPPSRPRFGATCEKLLGDTHTRFIHTLKGRTFPISESRLRTGELNPKKQAVWDLESLAQKFEEFYFSSYVNLTHTGIFMSPQEARMQDEKWHGTKGGRRITDVREFLYFTTPTVGSKSGQRKVQGSKGVKVDGDYYFCKQFLEKRLSRKIVQVRQDPETRECIAMIDKEWVDLEFRPSNNVLKLIRGASGKGRASNRIEEINGLKRIAANDYVKKNPDILGEFYTKTAQKEKELIDRKDEINKIQVEAKPAKLPDLWSYPKPVAKRIG
jgi:transposase InsO family protein